MGRQLCQCYVLHCEMPCMRIDHHIAMTVVMRDIQHRSNRICAEHSPIELQEVVIEIEVLNRVCPELVVKYEGI